MLGVLKFAKEPASVGMAGKLGLEISSSTIDGALVWLFESKSVFTRLVRRRIGLDLLIGGDLGHGLGR